MAVVQKFYPKRILSASTTGNLLEDITRTLEGGITNILIDFQHVMFMDSTGLSAMVLLLKQVNEVKGRLALCRLNGQAYMVLEHSGMDQVFEIYDTPDAFDRALESNTGEPFAK